MLCPFVLFDSCGCLIVFQLFSLFARLFSLFVLLLV